MIDRKSKSFSERARTDPDVMTRQSAVAAGLEVRSDRRMPSTAEPVVDVDVGRRSPTTLPIGVRVRAVRPRAGRLRIIIIIIIFRFCFVSTTTTKTATPTADDDAQLQQPPPPLRGVCRTTVNNVYDDRSREIVARVFV